MAEIKIIRLDFRLIHGQVITKWIKQTDANKILIIDDSLSKDDFMRSIYVMAAPPNIEVMVNSVEDAVKKWNNNEYKDAKLFVLFKDVSTAYRTFEAGLPIKELQIGGLGAGPGRKVVFGPITMDDKDAKELKYMHDKGVHVYLHQVPDNPSLEFIKILEKNIFNVE